MPTPTSSFGAPETPVTPPEADDALTILVGEGRKFASIEELAKGKLESDSHIERLEDEAKNLRDDLANRKTAADLVAELRTQGNNTETPTPPGEHTSSQLSADDVAALVKQTLESTQTESIMTTNLASVEAKLVEVFGEDHKQNKVTAKAAELGVGVDFLLSIAQKSPTAFYQTMGMNNPAPAGNPPVTTGGQSTDTTNINPTGATPAEGTSAYYRNMRRTNRSKYYAADTQIKLINDRQRLGDGFYK